MYHAISKRKSLYWNIKLPVYGPGANDAMKNYADRIDTEFIKTKEDDGEFIYCLPRSRKNPKIVYAPYDLEKVEAKEIEKLDIYFTCSASNVTMVIIKIEIFSFYLIFFTHFDIILG